MVDHDVPTGPLNRCQICGCDDLKLILDVGHQPLCDTLLAPEMLRQPETHYPLRLNRCPRCGLGQLDYVVDGSVVYHAEYPYRSGITKELAEYQDAMSRELVGKYGIVQQSLVIDIGSNDGTLLSGFKKLDMRVLGVEPTNIAKIANAAGVETLQGFFTERAARDIRRDRGPAKLITATNVFAHMAPLGEVTRGIKALLDDKGIFVVENHYLLEAIATSQYDTIYHEHIRTYSLTALVRLFAQYDMDVFDVRLVTRYGGNIRASVCQRGAYAIDPSVGRLLQQERKAGLFDEAFYERFRDKVYRSRDKLMEIAHSARKSGQRFVGNSCPGRASTLLNFCGMTPDLMPYLAEQPTSLKLGKYLPGMHIPVVENTILAREQPDLVVLLAWHYAEPITRYLRERGVKSSLIQPLPEVAVLAN